MSSSDDREERSPLVYSLSVDNSAQDPVARRTSSVHGASTIISRISTSINPPWRAIAGVCGLLTITITVVLIMYFFTTALVPAAFPIPHGISKRSLEHCDFANEIDSEFSPWNNLQPLETQMKFVKDRRRMFFVKRHGDKLTEANLCALKSAGREGRVFLIVLVPAMTVRDEITAVDEIKEAGLDREVDVMVADRARYFSETPLSGYDEDDGLWSRELKDFAVKVVTLWRFGGAAYDLDLVTLKIKPRSVALEPAPRVEPRASFNEAVTLKLSSSDEPPRTALDTSLGPQPKVEASEPSTSREPRSVTATLIEPKTLTMNNSTETDPRFMIASNSTWKNIAQREPIAATMATLPLSTGNESKDSRATLMNIPSTEPLPFALKPTTDIETDTVVIKLSEIERQTVALSHSPEATPRSSTLTASPPLEPRIVALSHPSGTEPLALVDGNATVSQDGAILVAHQPCHAFVFAVMRALLELDLQGPADGKEVTPSTVVQRALQSFCGTDAGSCNGVKVIPEDRLCAGVAGEGSRCQWMRVNRAGRDFDWSEHCS